MITLVCAPAHSDISGNCKADGLRTGPSILITEKWEKVETPLASFGLLLDCWAPDQIRKRWLQLQDSYGPWCIVKGLRNSSFTGKIHLSMVVGFLNEHHRIGFHTERLYILSDASCISCLEEEHLNISYSNVPFGQIKAKQPRITYGTFRDPSEMADIEINHQADLKSIWGFFADS